MRQGEISYQINNLNSLQARAGAKITGAIQQASRKTGVDFSYLLQQAHVESSFNSKARAKGSSASGLFQFIESTWLSMVKKYGDKYGLGDLADKISDSGRVASAAVRKKILALRHDPELASLMAGEYASENKDYLEKRVGGEIGSTELYLAHFMGPAGAGKFLEALNSNPSSRGARIFSQEACANPSIFYDKSGREKSLKEIYAYFDGKFADEDYNAPVITGREAALNYAAKIETSKTPEFDAFNENTGKWYKTRNRIFDLQADAGEEKRVAAGTIPGRHSLMVNPVDVMALLDYGQSDRENKAASLWG